MHLFKNLPNTVSDVVITAQCLSLCGSHQPAGMMQSLNRNEPAPGAAWAEGKSRGEEGGRPGWKCVA